MLDSLGIRFLAQAPPTGSVLLEGDHDMVLAALSWLLACLASYVALAVAQRLRAVSGSQRAVWIILCGVAMGGGIWSMHFLGMLAYRTPIHLSYGAPLTLISLLVAVLGTCVAVEIVNRGALRFWRVLIGGLLMGLSVAGMHYTGMAAIRSEGFFLYDATLFSASVAIAIAASVAALTLTHLVRDVPVQWRMALRVCAAIVMGVAVAGMHYTGMAAAKLFVTKPLTELMPPLGTNGPLAIAVVVVTLCLLIISMLSVAFGRRLESEAVRLQNTVFRYDQILESVPDGILLIDDTLQIVDVNRAAAHLFQMDEQKSLPNLAELLPEIGSLLPESSNGRRELFFEAEASSSRGRRFPIELSISQLRDGEQRMVVVVCRDISARKRSEAHIQQLLHENQRLAQTDSLTGLANRRQISESLSSEISRCKRYGHELSLLLLDIDYFKRINDTHGHAAGDQALRVMAKILRGIARDSDLTCRYGGEEFVLVLPETGIRQAATVAERLRERVEGSEVHLQDGQGVLRMTCSVGVAPWSGNMHYDELLDTADAALYKAKDSGRNRCVVAEHVADPKQRSAEKPSEDEKNKKDRKGDQTTNVIPIDRPSS